MNMDPSNIREQLFQNNPFFSGTAIDPWENEDPDLVSLNHSAYEHICGLIRATYQNPSESLAGLVLGNSGMGKTHLLKRLLNYTRHNSMSAIFASVRPFLDPLRPKRHLLSEIVINLARVETPRESSNARLKISQFEYLVAKIIEEYRKKNPNSKGFRFQDWRDHFQRSCPGIHGYLLSAIFHYRHPKKQDLILNWLEGRVHEDHVSIMHFPDRASMDDLALEAEAHNIIVSLGMLLKYCGMSMVICFDQLDGMKDKRLIDAFGDAVQLLINEVNSMLPLAFIRMDTWTERFYNKLDSAVIERLRGNVIRLWGCTVVQAGELIKERIRHRFKNDGVEEKFQWLMKQLSGKLKENDSPREVIYLANRAITQIELPVPSIIELTDEDIIETFKVEYHHERDKVALDFDKWQPDAERMLLALTTYLKNRPEYDTLQPSPDKFISLVGKRREPNGEEIDCAFIINTAEHPRTIQASFDRGVKFLHEHPKGCCYYISDARCTFRDKTRWIKVHEVKETFDNLRGNTLFLDIHQAVTWYGLTSLIFKLEEGNITLRTSTGPRAATEKDFEIYMKNGFNEKFLDPADQNSSNEQNEQKKQKSLLDEVQLEKKMTSILKQAPMRLMLATLLLGKLQKDGENVTYELLLEFIGKRREVFIKYQSGDGSLISLK